jgi:hypothetical protein
VAPGARGIIAARNSHRVMLETAALRVLEVVIEPGAREPEHVHNPSIMIVDAPSRIRYYEERQLKFESPEDRAAPAATRAMRMEPEGPHAVENIDSHTYHAFRIEFMIGVGQTPSASRST